MSDSPPESPKSPSKRKPDLKVNIPDANGSVPEKKKKDDSPTRKASFGLTETPTRTDAPPVTFPGAPGTASPKTQVKLVRDRLVRQVSRDSITRRIRTVSSATSLSGTTGRVRSESVSSRRPSLSFSHSDAIPYYIPKPEPEVEVPWWTSRRLFLSLTCFIGFFFLYSLRVNLSTAIVCMNRAPVDPEDAIKDPSQNGTGGNVTLTNITVLEAIPGNNNTYNPIPTPTPPTTTRVITPDGIIECPVVAKSPESNSKAEFAWDKKLQGLILGAFFWGYTVMQIPSGYLSDRFGPRITVACGMFPVAILTILSPFLARGSPYLLLVGRMLIGCGEAMMYPGMQSLWSKWAPPHERSRLVGFAFGGSQLGNALTFPLAGLLCFYGFDGGWPSVFYVTGGACLLWCCWYVFYTRDSPGEMKGISAVERKYIEESLGTSGQTVEDRLKKRKQNKPWKKIFTSGPVWAILLANGCGNYGAYMLLTQMPTYMKEVLKFDIKSNGAFSMIPYLVFWVFIIIGGQIADLLIRKDILSIEKTRKLMCALGTVVPAIFLVLTGYMDCHRQVAAVVLLSLSMGFCGFQFSSFFINHGDIAPRYAGTVFGFTNTGASVPGIIAPYIVGAITPNQSAKEWRVTFYIAAGVYVLGAIIYAFLAKGEVQEWAQETDDYDKSGYPLNEIAEEDNEHEDHEDVEKNEKKPLTNEFTSSNKNKTEAA